MILDKYKYRNKVNTNPKTQNNLGITLYKFNRSYNL